MRNTPVKRALLIVLAFFLASPSISFAVIDKASPSSDKDIMSMNIKDVTVKETTRYGLELYRKGNYAEAVKVFKAILKKDCPNRLAQYHLQKIAQKGPEFTYLKDDLKKLPCEQFDFNEEDFLPASFYFEKDTDLMLEQLTAYNKRYRNSKATLTAKIAEYKAAAEQLEKRTQDMTEALSAGNKMSAETIAALKASLNQAVNDAKSMNDQITELNQALAQKASGPSSAAPAPTPGAAPAPTATEELTTIQAKFVNIQKRLDQIEISIAEKNRHILDLRNNLEAVKQ